jgi:hypothetical protein
MGINTVILLDPENEKIKIFGKTYMELSFFDIEFLKYVVEDNNCLYISEAEEMTADDIIQAVSNNYPIDSSSNKFIKTTVNDYVKVEDINLIFAGSKDIKSLKKLGNIFERSKKLRELFRQGKVVVISETEANSMRKAMPTMNLRDQALDKIILDKPARDFVNDAEDIFDDEENEVDENTKVETDADSFIQRYKK